MGNSAARTIRFLQDDRQRLELEKRLALLGQAELQHELNMLRHMRYQITGCLLDRRTNGNADHALAQIARVIRNSRDRGLS